MKTEIKIFFIDLTKKNVHQIFCSNFSTEPIFSYLLNFDERFGVEFRVKSRGIADEEAGRVRGRKNSSASL